MKITKPTFNIDLTEEDLKLAVEFWFASHYRAIKITHLKHNVGTREEGYGGMERDVPYQEGIVVTVEDL